MKIKDGKATQLQSPEHLRSRSIGDFPSRLASSHANCPSGDGWNDR
jgi:hypothetical protein